MAPHLQQRQMHVDVEVRAVAAEQLQRCKVTLTSRPRSSVTVASTHRMVFCSDVKFDVGWRFAGALVALSIEELARNMGPSQ